MQLLLAKMKGCIAKYGPPCTYRSCIFGTRWQR